jgi:hypothetical protein
MRAVRTKICATCREPRPLAASAQTPDGLRHSCREYTADSYRAWRERRLAMTPRLALWRVPGTSVVRRIAVTSARAAGGRGEGW